MLNVTELQFLRLGTVAFIAADPTLVILIPRIKQKTGDGGFTFTDGTPRVAQAFKFIPQTGAGGDTGILPTADGEGRRYDFIMLGLWNSVCEIGDHWVDDNDQYWEIVGFIPDNEYEMRAAVSSTGGTPNT